MEPLARDGCGRLPCAAGRPHVGLHTSPRESPDIGLSLAASSLGVVERVDPASNRGAISKGLNEPILELLQVVRRHGGARLGVVAVRPLLDQRQGAEGGLSPLGRI